MPKHIASAIVALGMAFSIIPAMAQDTREADSGDGPTKIDYALGDWEYSLDPAALVNACIYAKSEAIDETGVATIVAFARVAPPIQFEPLGTFDTPLTEAIAQHPVGFCMPLDELP